ncbi:MAG: DNA methyltransferase [Ktedonobacteraceae bacterium]
MQQAPLTIASFRLEKTGLVPLGTPTFENWLACGRFLKNAEKSIQFWIGDWLIYGEEHYGKTDYEKAIQETGLSYQTLRDYKWVATALPLLIRNDKLGFHHHRAVASLPQKTQTQFLDKAALGGWPLPKLKQEKYRYQLEQTRPVHVLSFPSPSRLLVGEPVALLQTLPSQSLDLVITAPDFASLSSAALADTLLLLSDKVKINSHIYIFCNRFEYPLLLPSVKQHFTIKNLLVWEKAAAPVSSPSPFLSVYDFIAFAHKGRRHLNGRRDASVFRWTAGLPVAPGEKPLALLEYLIEKSSQVGEVVCDPFASPAAPVGAAARNKGRKYVGMEIHEQ